MMVRVRDLIHGTVLVLGLALMVIGIATGTNGAVVIGLIVAAVSFGAWRTWRKA